MIDIQKWNYDTRSYDPYDIPEGARILLVTDDMDKKIDCTSCFRPITFGESYTSQEIHTSIGFGYPVCDNCYALETDRRREHRE